MSDALLTTSQGGSRVSLLRLEMGQKSTAPVRRGGRRRYCRGRWPGQGRCGRGRRRRLNGNLGPGRPFGNHQGVDLILRSDDPHLVEFAGNGSGRRSFHLTRPRRQFRNRLRRRLGPNQFDHHHRLWLGRRCRARWVHEQTRKRQKMQTDCKRRRPTLLKGPLPPEGSQFQAFPACVTIKRNRRHRGQGHAHGQRRHGRPRRPATLLHP